MKLPKFTVVSTAKMEGLGFLTKTKLTCKVVKLSSLLVHLVVEMIFINPLECQMHQFARFVT